MLQGSVTQLQELIDDTLLAVGSDAYLSALEVYGAAKRAKVPGLDELAASMGRRFKHTRPPPALRQPEPGRSATRRLRSQR